jgi:hypothetical protein
LARSGTALLRRKIPAIPHIHMRGVGLNHEKIQLVVEVDTLGSEIVSGQCIQYHFLESLT